MPGHGTVITTAQGQGEGTVYIDDNNQSGNYQTGQQTAVNTSGGTVNEGDVVDVDWSIAESRLEITSVGTRAKGTVNQAGTKINIQNSGDTALSGQVDISSSNGQNSGYAGATVWFGNVGGEGAYLSE